MNFAKQLPAVLLGLVFVVFGAMYFFTSPATPKDLSSEALAFMDLFATKTSYMNVVKVLEVLCGILILIPKTRAVGLLMLLPIALNILLFDVLVNKQMGLGPILVVVNLVAMWIAKDKYKSLLA